MILNHNPKFVDQTIFATKENIECGVFGNCMQAAIASLFGKPLDSVPNFAAFQCWSCAIRLWASGLGLNFCGNRDKNNPPEGLCIITGKSPRGYGHVCLFQDGQIIFDPHPSRDGLISIDGYWWFERSDEGAVCCLCNCDFPEKRR